MQCAASVPHGCECRGKLADDGDFRKQVAETVGTGFEVPSVLRPVRPKKSKEKRSEASVSWEIEPGGTRTPDLLVRRFGFEILTALSVCQLRVGRFEICPLIGLHRLQHWGHCVTHFILRTDVAKNPEDCEQGFHIPRLTAVLRLRSRLRLPSRLLQSRQGSDEDKFGTVMAANV